MRFGFRASSLHPDPCAPRSCPKPPPREFGGNRLRDPLLTEGALRTPDGRNPLIRTIWMIKLNETAPRFVTATPIEKGKK